MGKKMPIQRLSNAWMTKNMKLNSLNFLALYNDSLYKYESDKKLLIDYPTIIDVFKTHFTDKQIIVVKKADFNNLNFQNIQLDQIYFTLCRKTKKLSVLRHFRNSIAHSSILKEGAKIIIRDFYEDNKINYSCYGVISKACFKDLLSISE